MDDDAARPHTIPAFLEAALVHAGPQAFGERGDAGWTYCSGEAFRARVERVAYGLRARGLAPGDRIAVFAPNALAWLAADFAVLAAGCVAVPIFASTAPASLRFILARAEVRLLIVASAADATRLGAAAGLPPTVTLEGEGPNSLAALEAAGEAARRSGDLPPLPEADANDPALLVFTSGTSGDPKGVLLSHCNVLTNVRDVARHAYGAIRPGDRMLSVLPFAHLYEWTNVLCLLHLGVLCRITTPKRLAVDLRAVRPHVMALVPLLAERILAGVVRRATDVHPRLGAATAAALAVGRTDRARKDAGITPSFGARLRAAILERSFFPAIRRALGLDRARFLSCGGAALDPEVARTYGALRLPLCEGYGLTETSPVIAANRPHDNRIGSCGRPLPSLEVSFAADGEILVRGPSVMLGYLGIDRARHFTPEGRLRTGDLGELDADGYLHVLDRKNDVAKTAGGKYVSPARIERALLRSPHVAEAVVLAAGRVHPVALLVHASSGAPPPLDAAATYALLRGEAAVATADLDPHERIRTVVVLPRPLAEEDGVLTTTFKVRRRVLAERFRAEIDAAAAR